jgi:hypothetical protein
MWQLKGLRGPVPTGRPRTDTYPNAYSGGASNLWGAPPDRVNAGHDRGSALKRIARLASATEQIFHDRSGEWWGRAVEQLTGLTGTGSLLTSRGHFKESFYATLSDSRILSEHQLYGAFADWWEGNHDDLRRLDRGVREKEGNSRNELEQILYMLGNRLLSRLSDLVVAERQALIDLYRSWADQYATSLWTPKNDATPEHADFSHVCSNSDTLHHLHNMPTPRITNYANHVRKCWADSIDRRNTEGIRELRWFVVGRVRRRRRPSVSGSRG